MVCTNAIQFSSVQSLSRVRLLATSCLSTGKAIGTPGSCHHSQSPPDVSVRSRATLVRKCKRKLRQFKVLKKKKITHFKCPIDQSCTLNAPFPVPQSARGPKTVLFSPKVFPVIWFLWTQLKQIPDYLWAPLVLWSISTVCHACGRENRQDRWHVSAISVPHKDVSGNELGKLQSSEN